MIYEQQCTRPKYNARRFFVFFLCTAGHLRVRPRTCRISGVDGAYALFFGFSFRVNCAFVDVGQLNTPPRDLDIESGVNFASS